MLVAHSSIPLRSERKVTMRIPRRDSHYNVVDALHGNIGEMATTNEPCLVSSIMLDVKHKMGSYLLVATWW
jgi:hypothetical protein